MNNLESVPYSHRSLNDNLLEEIIRCTELVAVYRSIGPAGAFGAAVIQQSVDAAKEALGKQDAVAMVRCFEDLKKRD